MSQFEYMDKIKELLEKVYEVNKDKIEELSVIFAKNIKDDKIIHAFGTGHSHMIGIELFARAGGLGNVNALLDPDALTAFGARRSGAAEQLSGLADVIFDSYVISKGDIMIISSNSGRNALPIEMAMRCKKEGVYTIALTNLQQSINSKSRHASGKRLFECVDCVLDNAVPYGDALMDIDGIKTGPGSSISSMFVLNTIVTEAMKICVKEGVRPNVLQSQNVDGFDNDSIYKKYESRVKHF